MPSIATRARETLRRVAITTATKLADAAGRPFRAADLAREHAAPAGRGARAWSYAAVASGLTPKKLGALLTAADQGDLKDLLTLAGDIERRDSHIGAQLRTRKFALASLPWKIEAVSDDAREVALAEELQALIGRPDFTFLVINLMDAVMKGYAVAEIGWERGAKWTPKKFTWRDQRHFVVSKEDGTSLRMLSEEKPQDGEELPAFVFIVHAPVLTSGPLALAGLARPLAVMYACKTLGIGAWLAYMEIFGVPTRLGKYPAGMPEEDRDALKKAIAAIGFDGYGVMPATAQVELLDAIGRGNGTGEHERLTEWVDRQTSKAILGQTMTADAGSSLSQAKVHQLVRRDILLADAMALAATLQRDLINVYVDINYGPRVEYPKLVCQTAEPEDKKVFVDTLAQMVDRGLQVEQSVVRDRLGLPEPAAGAEVLTRGGGAPAQLAGAMRQRAAQPGDDGDFIDRESDPAEDVERPLLDEVRSASKSATSFEGFLSRLSTTSVDVDTLVKDLALRQVEARGVGDATDEVNP